METQRTVGVLVGVGSSVFSGELSDEELTDEFDIMDLFPRLETFSDSFCSSGSLSESCVMSDCEIDAVWLPSCSSASSAFSSSSTTVHSNVFVSEVWSTLVGFSGEAFSPLSQFLSFVERQAEAGVDEARRFIGDKVLSDVRSMTVFSFEGAGLLRLKKPSSGPRPLTKGGPLCTGGAQDSFSLSKAAGSGQACAQTRLGGWFSLGSGLRRLNGRRAAGGNFSCINGCCISQYNKQQMMGKGIH